MPARRSVQQIETAQTMLGTHCISRSPGCSGAPMIRAPARPRIRSHHGFRHRESRKRSTGSGHRPSGRQPSRMKPGVLKGDRATRQRHQFASPLIRRSQRTTASGFALSGVVEPDGWRGMTGQPTVALIAKLWMPGLTPKQGAEVGAGGYCSSPAPAGKRETERSHRARRRMEGARRGSKSAAPLHPPGSPGGAGSSSPQVERFGDPVGTDGEILMATGVADRSGHVGSLRGCRCLWLEHDPRGDSAGFDVGYGLVDLVERSGFADHACLAGCVKLEHLA